MGALRNSETAYSIMSMLNWGSSPVLTRMFDGPAFPDESLVIVSSPLFSHKLSKGYSNPLGQAVKTVNGVRIKNLAHLVETLRDTRDEFIRVEVDSRGSETFVFRRTEMLAATEEILGDNGIRSQGSPDTMAIWNKPGKN